MPGRLPNSIRDAKVRPIVAGTPGTLTDVFGIRQVELSPDLEQNEAEGDDRVMATRTTLNYIELKITQTGIDLPTEAMISGGVVTTTGTGATAVTTLERKIDDRPTPFTLETRSPAFDSDGGEFGLELLFCQGGGAPELSLEQKEWAGHEYEARATANAAGVLYRKKTFAAVSEVA